MCRPRRARADGGRRLGLPRITLLAHILLGLDSLPDLAVQTTQTLAVVLGLGQQDRVTIPQLDEELVPAFDAELLSHRGRNGNLMLLAHLHADRHAYLQLAKSMC